MGQLDEIDGLDSTISCHKFLTPNPNTTMKYTALFLATISGLASATDSTIRGSGLSSSYHDRNLLFDSGPVSGPLCCDDDAECDKDNKVKFKGDDGTKFEASLKCKGSGAAKSFILTDLLESIKSESDRNQGLGFYVGTDGKYDMIYGLVDRLCHLEVYEFLNQLFSLCFHLFYRWGGRRYCG